jgi:hypothetical protein
MMLDKTVIVDFVDDETAPHFLACVDGTTGRQFLERLRNRAAVIDMAFKMLRWACREDRKPEA